jgi:FixJ family two-component response regulator
MGMDDPTVRCLDDDYRVREALNRLLASAGRWGLSLASVIGVGDSP